MNCNNIEISQNQLIKNVGPPAFSRVEAEKTHLAYEIAVETELFRVPQVIDFDKNQGRIIYERLQFIPVSQVKWAHRSKVAKQLGMALAEIHNHMRLPDHLKYPLPSSISYPYEQVFIHGDLSVDNVGIDPSTSKLIILDWQTTRHYGGIATYDTRFYDIFWFILNLVLRPYTRFLFSDPVTPIVRIFLNSYLARVNDSVEISHLNKYARIFFPIELTRSHNEILCNSKGRAILLFPMCRMISNNILKLFLTVGQAGRT